MTGMGTIRLVGLASLVLALGACEGVKKQFGLTKQSPDEFRVVARAPLSLPPDFTLRPPEPGATRPQEGTTAQQARQTVFGNARGASATPDAALGSFRFPRGQGSGKSVGERSLLASAGAAAADPDIRALVDREADELRDQGGFLESLVFWRDEEPAGVIVDADAEARRLRENAALGKEVTEGETPSIERKKKALFEGIF